MTVVISRITTQKKSKQRYNIYLKTEDSDRYAFSLDEDVLIEFGLKKGMELSEELLEEITNKDQFHKSYTLAIKYLSYRMRSIKEMKNYLLDKEVIPSEVDSIIDKLIREGYLNDEQFAYAFVQTRINTSTKGPLLIQIELSEKGISATNLEKALQLYTYDMQYEKAVKIAKKKKKGTSKHSYRKQIQQLAGNLTQKGFTQDVIQDVLQTMEEEKDTNAEWEALQYQGEKLRSKYERKWDGYELEQRVTQGLFRKGFSIEEIRKFLDERKRSS